MAEHTLSASCPFISCLAAAASCFPLPLTPPSWSDPIPQPGKEAAAGFSLQEVGGARALGLFGTFWDLARFMPASAPPLLGIVRYFNYSPLWEAAEDTSNFGGSWLGTSAASSLCPP